MDLFLTLLGNIAPLYGIIVLGWLAGRFYGVERESLAGLAIYIIVPIVSFYYVSGLEFKMAYIALPILVYGLYSFMSLLFYKIGQRVYPDKRANLLAMCAAASNTGYLGLPIVILLFPPEWVGVYVFALSGGLLYEATVFYYIANRGNFTPKDSFIRVLKFPVLYAIAAGLIVNAAHLDLPHQLDAIWAYFKGAYVVIGMMIIGCSLSKVSKLVIAPKFLALTFLGQFILWPLLGLSFIALDQSVLHWFEPQVHKMLLIMSIVPPAANIAAFAATLDLNPEKAATTVLLGTIFALFYIPAVLVLSGLY
ncbi:MAG: AEC family transporter [Alphaproteobacteria bacterium]|nr:AEC family transporter [Alphaproteobacteria bacterium]